MVFYSLLRKIFLNTFGKPDSITTVENEIGWLTEKDDSIQYYWYHGSCFSIYRNDSGHQEVSVCSIDLSSSPRWIIRIGKTSLSSRSEYLEVLKLFRHHIDTIETRKSEMWLYTTRNGPSDDYYLLHFAHHRLHSFSYYYPD